MVTLDEVARQAGVSKSVASRALSGDANARISEATRAKILETAQKLSYVANHRSRALRWSRSGAIALVVPNVNNAVFASMSDGVRAAAARHDFTVLLGEARRGSGDTDYLHKVVREGRADGILLQRPEDYGDDELRALIGDSLRLVLVNSRLETRPGSVILPDAEGARIAVEHLIGLGHTRIGHFSGFMQHDTARRRHQGFRAALEGHGVRVNDDWVIESGWEASGGAAAMRELLSGGSRPTGILVSSVNAAIGALGEAVRAGLDIPADLSIVTINDTWVAEAVVPALTTVKMPLRELGEQAAEMLLGYVVDGREPTDAVTLGSPELVVRDSTAPPPRA